MQSDLGRLETVFKQMAADGLDLDAPLKWGFYFFDGDRNKLLALFEELKDHGYKQEDVSEMEDGEWRLFVSKVEVLTPEKLHKRNVAFNTLAEHCEVALYDGWDVEKVE
jgi:hypothetical protein